jgi:hypothetical protein
MARGPPARTGQRVPIVLPSDAQRTELHRRKFHHAFARRGGCRLAVFFFQPCAPFVRFSAPRFVRQLIYFTQHEIVSKRKARSALGIDTPTIRFRY